MKNIFLSKCKKCGNFTNKKAEFSIKQYNNKELNLTFYETSLCHACLYSFSNNFIRVMSKIYGRKKALEFFKKCFTIKKLKVSEGDKEKVVFT